MRKTTYGNSESEESFHVLLGVKRKEMVHSLTFK